jgi:hypothetical protein
MARHSKAKCYYTATVRGVVDKTNNGYRYVANGQSAMRKSGELPYEWITDNTRWVFLHAAASSRAASSPRNGSSSATPRIVLDQNAKVEN